MTTLYDRVGLGNVYDVPAAEPPSGEQIGIRLDRGDRRDDWQVVRAGWVDGGWYYGRPLAARSFFRDLWLEHLDRRSLQDGVAHPGVRGRLVDPEPPSFTVTEDGGVAGAVERLRSLRVRSARQMADARERRDVSSAAGSGGEFVPSPESLPTVVAEQFVLSARDRGVMPGVLPSIMLPPTGLSVSAPRFTTGASTSVHAESAVVSETDPATGIATSQVITIAGHVDVTRQALERSEPGLDEALSAELGRSYAETLDRQVISGTGTDQLTGLLNVAGSTSVTYTETTPTQAAAWKAIAQALAETGTAYGQRIPVVLAHTRRIPWLYADVSLTPRLPDGVRLVPVPAMPTTEGAGSDEDRIVAFDPSASPLAVSPPRFLVHESVLSDTATVRIQVVSYAALLSTRQPASIGVVSGTGLAGVDFT